MSQSTILDLMFPEGLLDYFEITNYKKSPEKISFYMEEKNIKPEEYKTAKLTSKGFYKEQTIEDFPLRGHQVTLKVKRRRWTNEDSGKIISRDWDIVAKGTRKTQEFASFLKEINR
jgi:hypothetical protein